MSGQVTSAQVAAHAGVSRSAVSRVFTPGASVSAQTAAKVRAAARELGYRPNPLARSLITGQSRIIGLVVAYLENQFYPEAVEKLSKALQERGYHVLIFMADNAREASAKVIDELMDYRVAGIVMASVSLSNDLTRRCEAAGIPVLLFNRHQDDAHLSSVTSDNRAGGAALADFLLDARHARIGHIAGWEGASTQREREAGFCAALQARGTTLAARTVGNFHYADAQAAAREMFGGDAPPDAVFVANDHMAFAVMDTLRFELGIDVPGEVSVVGYDDVPLAAWPSYALTTIRQRANRMVSETVEILLERIETPEMSPRHARLDAPLIIRGSARTTKGPTP
ncbi:LacI family DNA-binding transcriptional regulator [Sulfitobacter albidus]|uniref:LacI family DNA-binding transcriptional regulator n=1 Tax=Sulfitobacter albidus TaxID=2829501 RepID=A0A975JBL2_9RHOB|nr:LacI family DNA-binding transcriptional regulator [Sulfitobacter albidus]QUJ75436.1 LacI family DNA-binding transcriptional regulator [Sulfitobacter albidus]